HLGHLIIAEYVREELGLEEVWFIPTYEPPHKQNAKIGVNQRVAMLERAIKNHSSFKLNNIEINRFGKSYTIDTILKLKQKNSNHKYYFIIGGDMVEYLPHWKQIDDLIHYLTFVGVKRAGYSLESPYPITKVDVPLIDISSTMVRNRVNDGKSIKYLVPESVYSYIKEYRLYESEYCNKNC